MRPTRKVAKAISKKVAYFSISCLGERLSRVFGKKHPAGCLPQMRIDGYGFVVMESVEADAVGDLMADSLDRNQFFMSLIVTHGREAFQIGISASVHNLASGMRNRRASIPKSLPPQFSFRNRSYKIAPRKVFVV